MYFKTAFGNQYQVANSLFAIFLTMIGRPTTSTYMYVDIKHQVKAQQAQGQQVHFHQA